MNKATPDTVIRDDVVFVQYGNITVPFRVVRKSPKSLILKSKEEGVKKAFWSEEKERYKIEGKYLLLN